MPNIAGKSIVYLFGAGATHAELFNQDPNLIKERRGLLIGDVSSRVIERARRQKRYLKGLQMVSSTSGSLNIELLISLIENSKSHDWAYKTELLKNLVKSDIEGILTSARTKRFYLHKALFELHQHRLAIAKEKLIGLISLNYDDVLDRAYKAYFGGPNYCFAMTDDSAAASSIPLLKLHGSFNWTDKIIGGRRRTVEIIPLGSNKTYLHVPYGYIWSRALDVLTRCDTLRIVGCSLSQNDAHLIDLLFKAHLERASPLEIEIIAPEDVGDRIIKNYGFFPHIRTLLTIEKRLVPEPAPDNAFKTWLKYKSLDMLGQARVRRTTHLQRTVS